MTCNISKENPEIREMLDAVKVIHKKLADDDVSAWKDGRGHPEIMLSRTLGHILYIYDMD